MITCFRNKEVKEDSWAMRNGRMLFEESISLFDGKVNPIRFVSARDLQISGNSFGDSQYKLYKGFLQGKAVLVKRSKWGREYSIRSIVVGSRLSVHKNVLKLIGCCLETVIPLVVYEPFDSEGSLYDALLRDSIGHDPRPLLPWRCRLKIAVDLSNLVAYIYTALPRPLVHRDINPFSVLLGKENGIVKLFDFGFCVYLPEGKSFIEDKAIRGRWGYIDPEYQSASRFNEKTDVYAFGVTLLNLLSGRGTLMEGKSLVFHSRDCAENERFEEILDPRLSADGAWPGKDGQFKAFLMLALECTRDRGVDRPDMTEVGTRLAGMYRSAVSTTAGTDGFCDLQVQKGN